MATLTNYVDAANGNYVFEWTHTGADPAQWIVESSSDGGSTWSTLYTGYLGSARTFTEAVDNGSTGDSDLYRVAEADAGGFPTGNSSNSIEIIYFATTAHVIEVVIPSNNYTFTYEFDNNVSSDSLDIYWGDGNSDTGLTGNANRWSQAHTYSTAGTYTIAIEGDLKKLYLPGMSSADLSTIRKLQQIGGMATFVDAYAVCNGMTALEHIPNAIPTQIISLIYFFSGSGNAPIWSDSGEIAKIQGWDVSNVTRFDNLFNGIGNFDADLSGWDWSAATNLSGMFKDCTSFNSPLPSTFPPNCDNMQNTFNGCDLFNQDISSWGVNVTNVTNWVSTFANTDNFNQDISGWDVGGSGAVMYVQNMFENAIAFNQDVSGWDVSNSNRMTSVFYGATSFDQDLSAWDVTGVTATTGGSMQNMFDNTGMSATNYSNTLIGWAAQSVNSGNGSSSGTGSFVLGAAGVSYDSSATSARNTLTTTYNWVINDAGLAAATTTTTAAPSIFSITNVSYDTTLYSGAGGWVLDFTNTGGSPSSIAVQSSNSSTGPWTNVTTISNTETTYQISGQYQSSGTQMWFRVAGLDGSNAVTGTPSAAEQLMFFSTTAHVLEIVIPGNNTTITLNLNQQTSSDTMDFYWGDGNSDTGVVYTAFSWSQTHTYASAGTYTIVIDGDLRSFSAMSSTDAAMVTKCQQIAGMSTCTVALDMFNGMTSLSHVPKTLPSQITNFQRMFANTGTAPLHTNLTGWDVSNVYYYYDCFKNNTAFNMDLSSWDWSAATNLTGMFQGCTSFNNKLPATTGGWTTPGVNMKSMLQGCSAFNDSSVTTWDVSNVTSFYSLFQDATSFNQDISGWNVQGNIQYGLVAMFTGATAFNQDISGWDVSGCVSFLNTFQNASSFDQDLGSWDVTGVAPNPYQSMDDMFKNCGMSTANYSNTLIGWAAQSVQSGTTGTAFNLGADGLYYNSAGQTARNTLVNTYNWTIIDAGLDPTITTTTTTQAPPVTLDATVGGSAFAAAAQGAYTNSGRITATQSAASLLSNGILTDTSATVSIDTSRTAATLASWRPVLDSPYFQKGTSYIVIASPDGTQQSAKWILCDSGIPAAHNVYVSNAGGSQCCLPYSTTGNTLSASQSSCLTTDQWGSNATIVP